jgi:hypothetical protein
MLLFRSAGERREAGLGIRGVRIRKPGRAGCAGDK